MVKIDEYVASTGLSKTKATALPDEVLCKEALPDDANSQRL
jgi:hypothetical protein